MEWNPASKLQARSARRKWKGRSLGSKLKVATMRNSSLTIASIVASIAALITLPANAPAQQPDKPSQGQSAQSIPDAPQPQKKPAPKQPQPDAPSADSSAPSAPPADAAAPKQPAAKDENAFPEEVSREAAKKAAVDATGDGNSPASGSSAPDASDKTKPSSAAANPFPESVSRDAAKAAGNDPTPVPAAGADLPPGVSSSQSNSAASGEESAPQEADPARARKDTEVGSFYLKTGDYQGALLRYKDATAADPTNVAAIFGLAEAQRSLGKNVEAARYYQMYLEIVPNGPKSKEAIKALKTLQPGK
jgi:tetratricopeptide (TPR) repeat protein